MTHPKIEQLLPWYLNNTLAEGERRAVADHLQQCAECARELRALEDVRLAVRNAAQETPGPSPFLMTRALASIDEYERMRADGRRPWLAWWRPIPKLARVALVLQLAVIIGLGGYFLASRDRRPYATASSGATAKQGRGARLAVMFDPGVSEARIRELIRALDASIVGGPSA